MLPGLREGLSCGPRPLIWPLPSSKELRTMGPCLYWYCNGFRIYFGQKVRTLNLVVCCYAGLYVCSHVCRCTCTCKSTYTLLHIQVMQGPQRSIKQVTIRVSWGRWSTENMTVLQAQNRERRKTSMHHPTSHVPTF